MKYVKRSATALFLATGLLCSTGCGTYFTIRGGPPGFGLYSGVRADVRNVQQPDCHFPLGNAAILDLPLSFAIDTLLLPVSLVYELFFKSERPSGE